jgi:hypothetical protein
MSLLGDFLQRLYAPEEHFETVRATLRYWHDQLYGAVASDNHMARMSERTPPREGWKPGDGPRECAAEIAVRLAGVDRGREEIRPTAGDHWFSAVSIVNGGCHWFSRDGQVRQRNAHREAGTLAHADRHFSRRFVRMLFAGLDLNEVGSARFAGCECIVIRARLTHGFRLWPHWFPYGADEYELHVDPERATILSIAAHVGEAVFETNQVVEVVYDEPAPEELFTAPTPAPVPVRPARKRRA